MGLSTASKRLLKTYNQSRKNNDSGYTPESSSNNTYTAPKSNLSSASQRLLNTVQQERGQVRTLQPRQNPIMTGAMDLLMKQNGVQRQSTPTIGRYGQGNINLYERPRYNNGDGSYSTVDSFSTNIDGKEVLLPTIGRDRNGNATRWTEDEAVDNYLKTGQHLGQFNTPEEADRYAQKLHEQQARFYGNLDEAEIENLRNLAADAGVNQKLMRHYELANENAKNWESDAGINQKLMRLYDLANENAKNWQSDAGVRPMTTAELGYRQERPEKYSVENIGDYYARAKYLSSKDKLTPEEKQEGKEILSVLKKNGSPARTAGTEMAKWEIVQNDLENRTNAVMRVGSSATMGFSDAFIRPLENLSKDLEIVYEKGKEPARNGYPQANPYQYLDEQRGYFQRQAPKAYTAGAVAGDIAKYKAMGAVLGGAEWFQGLSRTGQRYATSAAMGLLGAGEGYLDSIASGKTVEQAGKYALMRAESRIVATALTGALHEYGGKALDAVVNKAGLGDSFVDALTRVSDSATGQELIREAIPYLSAANDSGTQYAILSMLNNASRNYAFGEDNDIMKGAMTSYMTGFLFTLASDGGRQLLNDLAYLKDYRGGNIKGMDRASLRSFLSNLPTDSSYYVDREGNPDTAAYENAMGLRRVIAEAYDSMGADGSISNAGVIAIRNAAARVDPNDLIYAIFHWAGDRAMAGEKPETSDGYRNYEGNPWNVKMLPETAGMAEEPEYMAGPAAAIQLGGPVAEQTEPPNVINLPGPVETPTLESLAEQKVTGEARQAEMAQLDGEITALVEKQFAEGLTPEEETHLDALDRRYMELRDQARELPSETPEAVTEPVVRQETMSELPAEAQEPETRLSPIEERAKQFPDAVAKVYTDNWDPGKTDLVTYDEGFKAAYNAGLENKSTQEMFQDPAYVALVDADRTAADRAYMEGLKAQQTDEDKARLAELRQRYGMEVNDGGEQEGNDLLSQGSGRVLSFGERERDGRVPQVSGISAEQSSRIGKSLAAQAADPGIRGGAGRVLEEIRAEDAIGGAAPGQTVQRISEDSSLSVAKSAAMVRAYGNGVTFLPFVSQGDILTVLGEEARASANMVTRTIGVRANDEDAMSDQLTRHELIEIAIEDGKIDIDDALTTITGIVPDHILNRILQAYSPKVDLFDETLPDEVLEEALFHAKKELVCDAGAGINQFEGVGGLGTVLSKAVNDMHIILSNYANAKIGGVFDAEPEGFSADTFNTNKTISGNNKSQYSSKAKLPKKDPRKVTERDVRLSLKQVKMGKYYDNTFLPVRAHTPSILTEVVKEAKANGIEIPIEEISDKPLAWVVYKMAQSMVEKSDYAGGSEGHELGEDEIIQAIKAMDEPEQIYWQEDHRTIAELVKIDSGKRVLMAIDFNFDINEEYLNGYQGGQYNLTVTTYSPDAERWKKYIADKRHILIYEKGDSRRGSGRNWPSHSNDSPFYQSLTESGEDFKDLEEEVFLTDDDLDYYMKIFGETDQSVEDLLETKPKKGRDVHYSTKLKITADDLVKAYNREASKNARLETANAALADALSGQDWTPDRSAVRSIAKQLRDETGTSVRLMDVVAGLTSIYDRVHGSEGVDGMEVYAMERALVDDLLQNGKAQYDPQEVETYKKFTDILKANPIQKTDRLVAEFGGPKDFNEFARSVFPRMLFSNKGKPVDTVYRLLSEADPANFPADVGDLQGLDVIRENLQNMKPMPINGDMTAEETEQWTLDLVDKINDAYFDVKYNPTAIAGAKDAYNTAMREYREGLRQEYRERDYHRRLLRNEREARLELLRKANKALRLAKNRPGYASEATEDLLKDLDLTAVGMRLKTKQGLIEQEQKIREMGEQDETYREVFMPRALEAISRLHKTQISDLHIEEVHDLITQLTALIHYQETTNKLLKDKQGREVAEVGRQWTSELQSMDPADITNPVKNLGNKYMTNNLNPLRAMHRISGYSHDSAAMDLTRNILDGLTRRENFRQKADQLFRPFLDDKANADFVRNASKQNIPVEAGGKRFMISPGMRVALYMHSRNRANLAHIVSEKGGIRVPNADLYKRGDIENAYGRGVRVQMTLADVKRIIEGMTDAEKKYAELLVQFFDHIAKDAVNETSLELDGIFRALVDKYFPITTDPSFLAKEMGFTQDPTIEGWGNLKERQEGANAPILLEDATKVLQRHIEKTATYSGLAAPLRDFQKVWGYTSTGRKASLQDAIKNTWSANEVNYIENWIKDMNSGGRQAERGLFEAMRGRYAGAVLTLNPSVALKQTTSYFMAGSVLDTESLFYGLAHTFSDEDQKYMDSITPWGWTRRQGQSTIELGDLYRDKGLERRIPNWNVSMDVLTTNALFVAAERSVKKQYPDLQRGDKKYDAALAEKYNQVLWRTQPQYDSMFRPEYLRRTEAGFRTLGMFKTESMQMSGELIDAWAQWKADSKRYKASSNDENRTYKSESAKNFGKTLASWLASNLSFAIAGTAINVALMHKGKAYRNDRGEIDWQTLLRKTGLNFVGSAAGGFFAASTVWDIAQYLYNALSGSKNAAWYDIEVPGVSLINDAIENSGNFLTAMVNPDANAETKAKAAAKLALTLSKFTPIGFAENIVNMANSLILYTQDIQRAVETGDWKEAVSYEAGKGLLTDTSPTKLQYANRAVEAYRSGDMQKGNRALSLTNQSSLEKALDAKLGAALYRRFEADGQNLANYIAYVKDGKEPHLSDIQSNGYSDFNKLREAIGDPDRGSNWHHIVEQEQGEDRLAGFRPDQINNVNNIVSVPSGAKDVHQDITKYYNSVQDFSEGKTVREWLSGKTFEEQFDFGLDKLREYGDVFPTDRGWVFVPDEDRIEEKIPMDEGTGKSEAPASKITAGMKNDGVKGDARYVYLTDEVNRGTWTAQDAVDWYESDSQRINTDEYQTWIEHKWSRWDFVKTRSDLARFEGKDRQGKIRDYLHKNLPREKGLVFWTMVCGWSESTYDVKKK